MILYINTVALRAPLITSVSTATFIYTRSQRRACATCNVSIRKTFALRKTGFRLKRYRLCASVLIKYRLAGTNYGDYVNSRRSIMHSAYTHCNGQDKRLSGRSFARIAHLFASPLSAVNRINQVRATTLQHLYAAAYMQIWIMALYDAPSRQLSTIAALNAVRVELRHCESRKQMKIATT